MRRREARELLDDALPEQHLLQRNLAEMAWLFRWSGGQRLALRCLLPFLEPQHLLLELASGGGFGAVAIRQRVLNPLVVSDLQPAIAQIAASTAQSPALVLDGRALGCRSKSVDVVYCAQALHHFTPHEAVEALREWGRISRCGGVVVDLQRNWVNYWGARLLAYGPLTPLGKHDGPVSVQRAYTPNEVLAMAVAAGLPNPRIKRSLVYWALSWSHASVALESPAATTQGTQAPRPRAPTRRDYSAV